jgi:alpha-tubulin suppressor-like RCC1 family protein
VVAIAGGAYFSLFLRFDGEVWSCGYNGEGQLGTQNNTNSNTPVLATTSGMSIAAGSGHTLVLKTNGTVYACGQHNSGQLGLGGTGGAGTSTLLQLGLQGITKVFAGYSHSIFLKDDGTVWSAGDNYYGQLGDGGTNSYESLPVQVSGIGDAVDISAGDNHTVIKRADGTYWGCGSNELGQLANGTNGGGNIETEPIEMNVSCTITGISEEANSEMMVYPNPFSDQAIIQMEEPLKNAKLILYNSLGQTVQELNNLNGNSIETQRDGLPNGSYFLRLIDGNLTYTQKLMVE